MAQAADCKSVLCRFNSYRTLQFLRYKMYKQRGNAGGGIMKVQTGTVSSTVNGTTVELPADVKVCITPKKAQP